MTPPAELLEQFQSTKRDQGVEAAAQNLFRDIYGDDPQTAVVLTPQQIEERQVIADGLSEQGLLPQLSIAWVNKYSSQIDANGDGLITDVEVEDFADLLDGQDDGDVRDPLARRLFETFASQYERLIALSTDGTPDGVAFLDLEKAAYQMRMVTAFENADVFNALDTAGYGGEGDRRVGWHDLNNVINNPGQFPELIDQLATMGVTIEDLTYMRDNWDSPVVEQLMDDSGDLITPQSIAAARAELDNSIQGINDESGRLTYIMLPGTTAFWMRSGDVWTHYLAPNQVDSSYANVDVSADPPPVLNPEDGTISFHHSDGSQSVIEYDDQGNVTQVTQTSNGQTAQATLNAAGTVVHVLLPDGSTVEQNSTTGAWEHRMGTAVLGNVAGPPVISPDGYIGFNYGYEVGMDSWKLFDGEPGRWKIALNQDLASTDDPTLVEVHNPDETFHYVMRYSDTSLDYAQIRFNNGATVVLADNQINMITLPDGSTVEPLDASLPRDQWVWVHKQNGQEPVPVGVPELNSDGQLNLRNGEQIVDMFPYLTDEQQGDETHYDLILSNGSTETFNGQGQRIRWSLSSSAVIEYDATTNLPTSFTADGYVWRLNAETQTWMLNGEPTAITPQFSSNEEGVAVSFVNEDGTRTVYRANGVRQTEYGNGIVATYDAGSNLGLVDLPGDAQFSQVNGQWVFQGPDAALCEDVALASAPQVLADGTIVLALADGSVRHMRFDENGYVVEIADTGTLEPPQTILRTFENGLMIAMVLPNGRTTEFQYDENDEAIGVSLTVSGNTQTWTLGSDGRWRDSVGDPLNALEVTDEGILNIWDSPNNELTTYLLDGTRTSNIYHPLQSGGSIDAVEITLPNGDSAVMRGGIPLQVRTNGVTVNFDSQGNEVSVDLLDGTRLVKGDDGAWLHIRADGTTGPIVAVDANFDLVNGAELTSGGHLLYDANGNLNLLRSDGAIEIYDSAGNLRSVSNGSLSVSFTIEGELNVVNMPDGSRWVFDPTTSNWHHSVFRAHGPDFVDDGQILGQGAIAIFEGGVRIDAIGTADQIFNFDGSTAHVYPNQLIVHFPSGSENFSRIETADGQPFLYQEGGAWVMQTPPAEAQLIHLTQSPQLNADGSITLNYTDGTTTTYQFSQEDGGLESVVIDRPGEQGFVFLTYRDGQISRAVFSTDNVSDANDYSVSQDGENFYSYGGEALGQFELSPNGVLTMNGQTVLTGDGSFVISTDRGNEYHDAGGTFRLIDNEGQTIARRMPNGTIYETDGLTVSSVRFANGATISYDANVNQWIYRIDGSEAIVGEPLLEGDQLVFRAGDRTISMFNESDSTFNIVNEDGMIETFSAEGARMRLATTDGALVFHFDSAGEEFTTAQIGGETWTFEDSSLKWRSADGGLAEITPTAEGVTVSYEDNTVVVYSPSGAVRDITFSNGAAISYSSGGAIDAIETSSGLAWQLQNGTWVQVGGPQTGTVLIGVDPAGGNPLNGDSLVFTFADSSSYRITSAGIWEQVTQAIVAEIAPDAQPEVVPQAVERTLAGGVVIRDQVVNGVREVVITTPGQREPSRIVYDTSGRIASVFRPDGSELRFNSSTNAYVVYRRNVTSNIYQATSEVWSGTLGLNDRTFVLTFTPQNSDGILRVEYSPDGSWTTFGADYRELHNVNQSVVRYERVNGIEGVTEVTYPNSTARQFEYDPAGNLIRMIVTPPGQIYMPSDGNPSHWDEYVSDGGSPPTYTRVLGAPGIDGSLSVDRDGNFIVRHSDGSYQVVMTDGSAPTEVAGGAYQMTTTERSDLAADLNADPVFWRSFTDPSGRIDMAEVDALYADLSRVPNPSARQSEQIEILRRIQDSREAFIGADGTPILITEFITENLIVSTTYPVADVEVPVTNPANTFVFPSNITVADMASISLVRQGVFTPDAFNNPHSVELMQSMGLIPEGVTSFNQLLANADWRAQNGIPAGVTNAQQLFDHWKSTGRISADASGWSEIRSAEEVRVMELNSYRSDRGAAPLESPAGSGRYLRGWNSIAVGQVFILPPAIEQPALAGAA